MSRPELQIIVVPAASESRTYRVSYARLYALRGLAIGLGVFFAFLVATWGYMAARVSHVVELEAESRRIRDRPHAAHQIVAGGKNPPFASQDDGSNFARRRGGVDPRGHASHHGVGERIQPFGSVEGNDRDTVAFFVANDVALGS